MKTLYIECHYILSVSFIYCYAEYHYGQNVVILNVVVQNVVILNVVVQNVVILNVVVQNVVMLSVVAPPVLCLDFRPSL